MTVILLREMCGATRSSPWMESRWLYGMRTDSLRKLYEERRRGMTARIISGTEIAAQIREEIKQETASLKEKSGVIPGLVTILVGQNPASVSYVTAKGKTAKELGFYSIQDDQPENLSEQALLALIDKY